jgi:hypothetical protein
MSGFFVQTIRPGHVRCVECPWEMDVPDMGTAMALFEQHTKDGHQVNPYKVSGTFHFFDQEGLPDRKQLTT